MNNFQILKDKIKIVHDHYYFMAIGYNERKHIDVEYSSRIQVRVSKRINLKSGHYKYTDGINVDIKDQYSLIVDYAHFINNNQYINYWSIRNIISEIVKDPNIFFDYLKKVEKISVIF